MENIQIEVEKECNVNLPEFEKADRVHDWRNHVPGEIKQVWETLTEREKTLVAFVAIESAESEEWD